MKINLFIKTVFFLGLFVVVFGVGKTASASWLEGSWNQLQHAGGSSGANLGEPVDPRLIVAQIIKLLLTFVGTILLVLVIWAGYKWMTAQGNENQIAESKQTIMNATIGLIVILSAYAITIMVSNLAMGKKLNTGVGQGGGTLDSAIQNAF